MSIDLQKALKFSDGFVKNRTQMCPYFRDVYPKAELSAVTKAAYTAADEVFDMGVSANTAISHFQKDVPALKCGCSGENDTNGLWIRRAGQTLAEAMTLAGGRLLDIEFNEIKSGYRLRYSPEKQKTYVDIFLFDGLSSGAGYCSALAERTTELMQETHKILNSCPNDCDSACHECLMHYWNQRVHSLLDRYAANELLDWCETSELPHALSYEQQDVLLSPLNALGAEFTVHGDNRKHFVEFHGTCFEIMTIPSMWGEYSGLIPETVIAVSDKLLKYALPKADALIRSKLH